MTNFCVGLNERKNFVCGGFNEGSGLCWVVPCRFHNGGDSMEPISKGIELKAENLKDVMIEISDDSLL